MRWLTGNSELSNAPCFAVLVVAIYMLEGLALWGLGKHKIKWWTKVNNEHKVKGIGSWSVLFMQSLHYGKGYAMHAPPSHAASSGQRPKFDQEKTIQDQYSVIFSLMRNIRYMYLILAIIGFEHEQRQKLGSQKQLSANEMRTKGLRDLLIRQYSAAWCKLQIAHNCFTNTVELFAGL